MKSKGWAVAWGDAHVNALDECDAVDIVHRPWKYLSVGHFVKSDAEGVTLAMDQGEDGKIRTRSFIPRAMVMDEWPVNLNQPRKRKERKREDVRGVRDSSSSPDGTNSSREGL